MDLMFCKCKDNKALSESEIQEKQNILLFDALSNPDIKIKMIKQRDRYSSFTSLSNYENIFDSLLTKCFPKKSDHSLMNKVFIVTPTDKTVGIHKMLYDQVYIQSIDAPKQWSGYNTEYMKRVNKIDIETFLKYIWNDQLLNFTDTNVKVCKNKLESYVKNLLSSLNVLKSSRLDESVIENITQYIKERYITEFEMMISTNIREFSFRNNISETLSLFIEWDTILGCIPFYKNTETDSSLLSDVKKNHSCFPTSKLEQLLTVSNIVPPLNEVAVFLVENELQCWHLPTEQRLQVMGKCNVRLENKEVCLGSRGESLYYAELKVMHLSEKHFTFQTSKRYIIVENTVKKENRLKSEENKEESKTSPLFASLTKLNTSLFDENNPLSAFAKMKEKNDKMKEYLYRVSNDLDDIQYKMDSFLNEISPSNRNSIVDELVERGLENYLTNIKPKMDDWERTIRDHLTKFRMQAIKQLSSAPKDFYTFQERASELNIHNEVEIQDFMEEISSTDISKAMNLPGVSQLDEFNKCEYDIKIMQEKLSQYFELAVKFMGYLRDSQKTISTLRLEDSVKDIHLKTLKEQKSEIVKLSKKYRDISNEYVNTYKQQLSDLKKKIDTYVSSQTQTAAKTKQHFLNVRDSIITNTGSWVNTQNSADNKKMKQMKIMEERFEKQHHSSSNELDRSSELELEVETIRVDGTFRQANLNLSINDNTLVLYRDHLKQIWKGVMNHIIPIQESVTKTGVQLYNIDEEAVMKNYISAFINILYDRCYFISRKHLKECLSTYGINISIEMTIKKMLFSNTSETTTVIRRREHKTASQDQRNLEENTGMLMDMN